MQNEFKLEKELGKGIFSNVFLATRIKDGSKFAIKRMYKCLINDKRYMKYINNEIFILKQINCQHVIKLYKIITDINFIYLAFEYCNGGDLNNCLKKYMEMNNNRAFPQKVVQHIMRQIISGFIYLHSSDIIHRDIKLSNILVQFPTEEDKKKLNMMKANFKIADFGFARYIKKNLGVSVVGTPENMEPHILKKLDRINNDNEDCFEYDQKADIWSLGTITYQLLIGCPVFQANSFEELQEKLEKGEYRIPHDVNLSKEALYFLNCMLKYNPANRLDIISLSKQYFLTKDVSKFDNQLGKSIMFDINDERKNFEDFLKMYGVTDENINVKETEDNKTHQENKQGEHIEKEPEDYINEKGNGYYYNQDNNSSIQNIDKNTLKDLNELFDKINESSNYIEPLLVPTKPQHYLYSSSDPILNFMTAS